MGAAAKFTHVFPGSFKFRSSLNLIGCWSAFQSSEISIHAFNLKVTNVPNRPLVLYMTFLSCHNKIGFVGEIMQLIDTKVIISTLPIKCKGVGRGAKESSGKLKM